MNIRSLNGASTWHDLAKVMETCEAFDINWNHLYRHDFTSPPAFTLFHGDDMLSLEKGYRVPYMRVCVRGRWDEKHRSYGQVAAADVYPKSKAGLAAVLKMLLRRSDALQVQHSVGGWVFYRTQLRIYSNANYEYENTTNPILRSDMAKRMLAIQEKTGLPHSKLLQEAGHGA